MKNSNLFFNLSFIYSFVYCIFFIPFDFFWFLDAEVVKWGSSHLKVWWQTELNEKLEFKVDTMRQIDQWEYCCPIELTNRKPTRISLVRSRVRYWPRECWLVRCTVQKKLMSISSSTLSLYAKISLRQDIDLTATIY